MNLNVQGRATNDANRLAVALCAASDDFLWLNYCLDLGANAASDRWARSWLDGLASALSVCDSQREDTAMEAAPSQVGALADHLIKFPRTE